MPNSRQQIPQNPTLFVRQQIDHHINSQRKLLSERAQPDQTILQHSAVLQMIIDQQKQLLLMNERMIQDLKSMQNSSHAFLPIAKPIDVTAQRQQRLSHTFKGVTHEKHSNGKGCNLRRRENWRQKKAAEDFKQYVGYL